MLIIEHFGERERLLLWKLTKFSRLLRRLKNEQVVWSRWVGGLSMDGAWGPRCRRSAVQRWYTVCPNLKVQ